MLQILRHLQNEPATAFDLEAAIATIEDLMPVIPVDDKKCCDGENGEPFFDPQKCIHKPSDRSITTDNLKHSEKS